MSKKLGCGPLAALVIVIFVVLFVGANEGVGFYFTHCDEEDSNFFSCLFDEMSADEEAPKEEGTVTATGTYEYKGYNVVFTLNIPLQGGAVTGTVSDTCDANLKGTYSGGSVKGTITGVCSPFFVNIPVSGAFNGPVNKTGKTVSFQFNGSGGGKSHEGSTTLKW
jgi:hypothetical protein